VADLTSRGGAARIDGLQEFAKQLRGTGTGLQKALTETNKHFAEQVVVTALVNIATPVSSRVKASVRGLATQKEGRVVAGGARAPEFWGQEFGGRKRPRTMQFQPHKGREGYWLYPAYREVVKEIPDQFWENAEKNVLGKIFPG